MIDNRRASNFYLETSKDRKEVEEGTHREGDI